MSESYYYRGPAIDHTLLSPSGRCSKRARNAAMKREAAKLFPPGFFDNPTPTPEEQAKQKADGMRIAAKTLRDLAARGMDPHRYTHEAAKLEAEADSIMKSNAPDEARVLPSPPAGCSAWIAVKDRFPDDMRDVLTFGRYGVHKACFEWGTEDDPCWWSDEVRKADFKESVTHWAELPNASISGGTPSAECTGSTGGETMTGKCVKCGKDVKLGIDGSCKQCNAEICWDCWVAAGHECPSCGNFDGKRDTANAGAQAPSEAK